VDFHAGTRSAGSEKVAVDQSFWEQHGDLISAGITLVVALAVAIALDRLILRQAGRYASRISDVTVSRGTQTRLRLIRRLLFATIVVIGLALALSQFAKLEKLAAGILASSAVVGLVLGFAAQKVLANPLAGLLLAITQPFRIGDSITLEGETGRVDDLTLSYTFLDTGDGRLMVVPNETTVTSVIFNRSTGDRAAPPRASVWLPPGADLGAAKRALEGAEIPSMSVAEVTPDGIRIEVSGPADEARTSAGPEESLLREHAHETLRAAGLLSS
jgi:small-conductance mechanosensitive channel